MIPTTVKSPNSASTTTSSEAPLLADSSAEVTKAPLHRKYARKRTPLRPSLSITTSPRRCTMLVMYLWQLFVKIPHNTSQWLYVRLCRRVPWLATHLTLIVITSTLLVDQLCMMLVVPVLPLYMINNKQFTRPGHGTNDWINVLNLEWMSIEERCAFVIAVKGGVQVFASMLLTAWLTRRFGYKAVLLMGLFGMMISCELFAYGTSLPVFIFARAVQGISSSLVNAAGLSLLATQYRDEAKRDSAMGIAMCGMCIGYSAGPSAASILYDVGGKELPFHISAGLLVFIITVIYVITSNRVIGMADKRADTTLTSIPGKVVDLTSDHYKQQADALTSGNVSDDERQLVDNDDSEDEAHGHGSLGTPIGALLRDPYIMLCLADIIISCLPVSVLEAVLTIHLSQNVPNTTDVTTGTVWLPSSVAMLSATYITTLIMTKRHNAHPGIIQCALLLECLACVCLPQSTTTLGVSVWLAVLMFGDVQVETAVVPLISTIIDRRYGSSGHYGSGYALWDMAYSAVETVGPLVGGFAVVRIGFGPFMVLVAGLMLIAVPLNKRLHMLMQAESAQANKTVDDREMTGVTYIANGGAVNIGNTAL